MGSGFVIGKISAGSGEGNACGRAGYCTFLAFGVKRGSMAVFAIGRSRSAVCPENTNLWADDRGLMLISQELFPEND
jgi:hypothetical protein